MKNKMSDLRNHMFAVLEGLADEENPFDLKRATAMANVANVIVNAVKVEFQARKSLGLNEMDFIDTDKNLLN